MGLTLLTADATNLHPTVIAFSSRVRWPSASGAVKCCCRSTYDESVNGSVCVEGEGRDPEHCRRNARLGWQPLVPHQRHLLIVRHFCCCCCCLSTRSLRRIFVCV